MGIQLIYDQAVVVHGQRHSSSPADRAAWSRVAAQLEARLAAR